MARQETRIEDLRERLTGVIADWGAEMSMVLRELEEARNRLAEISSSADGHAEQIKVLEGRVAGQANLIETLKAEAAEASELRNEVRARDLEIQRVTSELDSKQELIHALRRDAEVSDRLKAAAKIRDKEIAALQKERRNAEKQVVELHAEVEALREQSDSQNSEDLAELEAVRAELEARKTLIKSLRADAARVTALETRLEEKREIVATLEASINKHVETIAELKRTSDIWKRKYQALRGVSADATLNELPLFSDTDIAVMQQLESTDVAAPEHTIAIDMRRPLSEARRKAAQNQNKG
jgi:chromosome segregation ATPase